MKIINIPKQCQQNQQLKNLYTILIAMPIASLVLLLVVLYLTNSWEMNSKNNISNSSSLANLNRNDKATSIEIKKLGLNKISQRGKRDKGSNADQTSKFGLEDNWDVSQEIGNEDPQLESWGANYQTDKTLDYKQIKYGIVENGFTNRWGGSMLPKDWSEQEFNYFSNLPRQYPKEWGGVIEISGDIVELEYNTIARRTILKIGEGESNPLILCIETFTPDGGFKDKSYYNAEMVLVQTSIDNHQAIVNKIKEDCARDLLHEKAPNCPESQGAIYVNSPCHASGIFGFIEHLNELVEPITKSKTQNNLKTPSKSKEVVIRLIEASEDAPKNIQEF